jgi:hypothetical protein
LNSYDAERIRKGDVMLRKTTIVLVTAFALGSTALSTVAFTRDGGSSQIGGTGRIDWSHSGDRGFDYRRYWPWAAYYQYCYGGNVYGDSYQTRRYRTRTGRQTHRAGCE